MALRFDATTEKVQTTAALSGAAGYSVFFRALRRAASAFGTIWAKENATASATKGHYIEFGAGGAVIEVQEIAGSRITGPTMTFDVWYDFLLVSTGTNSAALYWRMATENTVSSGTTATWDVTWTPALQTLGNDSYAPDDDFNGCIEDFWEWPVALSAAEARQAILDGPWTVDYPVWRQVSFEAGGEDCGLDLAGAGRNLVPTGTLGTEPPAPIVYPTLDITRRLSKPPAAPPPPTGQFWLAAAA